MGTEGPGQFHAAMSTGLEPAQWQPGPSPRCSTSAPIRGRAKDAEREVGSAGPLAFCLSKHSRGLGLTKPSPQETHSASSTRPYKRQLLCTQVHSPGALVGVPSPQLVSHTLVSYLVI